VVSGIQNQQLNLRNVSVYGSHEGKGKRWESLINEKNPKDIEALRLQCLHPPKERFTRYNPFPNVTLGDHDIDITKVDWDERPLSEVKRLSRLMNERYRLDGFIVLRSSTHLRKVRSEDLSRIAYSYRTASFHTVFNRKVSWKELISMLAWLCLFTKDQKLITWFHLQLIKGTFTLRHGFKKNKGIPRIVYRYGSQDKAIREFLANRRFIHNFLGVKQ
jgi:hypothetical protein